MRQQQGGEDNSSIGTGVVSTISPWQFSCSDDDQISLEQNQSRKSDIIKEMIRTYSGTDAEEGTDVAFESGFDNKFDDFIEAAEHSSEVTSVKADGALVTADADRQYTVQLVRFLSPLVRLVERSDDSKSEDNVRNDDSESQEVEQNNKTSDITAVLRLLRLSICVEVKYGVNHLQYC